MIPTITQQLNIDLEYLKNATTTAPPTTIPFHTITPYSKGSTSTTANYTLSTTIAPTTPKKITTAPKKITTAPKKITTAPKKITTAPARPITPKKVAVAPEGRKLNVYYKNKGSVIPSLHTMYTMRGQDKYGNKLQYILSPFNEAKLIIRGTDNTLYIPPPPASAFGSSKFAKDEKLFALLSKFKSK